MIDKEVLRYLNSVLVDVCYEISSSWRGFNEGLECIIEEFNSDSFSGFTVKTSYLKADDITRLIQYADEYNMGFMLYSVYPSVIKIQLKIEV